VRLGSLQQFNQVMADHSASFKADKNYTLVQVPTRLCFRCFLASLPFSLTDVARANHTQRLGHNVLKTGLRKISLSYSRISMADIAAKLQLPSATAAEHVCAKAIRDGVIEASIDHANGWLLSNDVVDLYATEVPPTQPQE